MWQAMLPSFAVAPMLDLTAPCPLLHRNNNRNILPPDLPCLTIILERLGQPTYKMKTLIGRRRTWPAADFCGKGMNANGTMEHPPMSRDSSITLIHFNWADTGHNCLCHQKPYWKETKIMKKFIWRQKVRSQWKRFFNFSSSVLYCAFKPPLFSLLYKNWHHLVFDQLMGTRDKFNSS